MSAALGPAPAGGPGWVNVVWLGVAILVAVFGRGFGTALLAGVRNMRAGLASKESEARQQERQFRATERDAAEQAAERVMTRMGEQLKDADRRIAELGEEVGQLREAQRQAFVREQHAMSTLTAHAVWDHAAIQELPEGFPAPPPLLPPRDVAHAREWGRSEG